MLQSDELTDVDLLQKAQHGDAEAFGLLYERHAQAVFRFLYSHLNNRMDAEDLTGEVFLRAWRSLPRYRYQGAPFLAFLFRVARNALVDAYRRSSTAATDTVADIETVADAAEPADVVHANLEREEVRRHLGRLREEYRLVLTLRFIGELSPEETAQVMEKSGGAVRVLQHRALAALRKLIEGEGVL